MKKTASLLLCTIIVISFIQSCFNNKISGNGNVTTKNITVGEFNVIKSYGFMDIHLVKGTPGEVTVTTDDNLQEFIIIENNNNVLNIRTKEGVNLKTKKGININIPFDKIYEVGLYGSGEIKSEDEILIKNFKVSLRGSGDIELVVTSNQVEAEITGSGDLELKGETDDLDVNVSGSGDFNGFRLKSKDAKVNVTGSGDAEVYAKKTLIANVNGSGDIEYKGNPSEKEIKTSGSGDVKAR